MQPPHPWPNPIDPYATIGGDREKRLREAGARFRESAYRGYRRSTEEYTLPEPLWRRLLPLAFAALAVAGVVASYVTLM